MHTSNVGRNKQGHSSRRRGQALWSNSSYSPNRKLGLESLEPRRLLSGSPGVEPLLAATAATESYSFDVVAKAQPDEWYNGVGQPYVPITDPQPAGATAKGIDNDATGNIFITDNYVVIETGATAIESASHGSLNNHVSTNGTVTDPFDDD